MNKKLKEFFDLVSQNPQLKQKLLSATTVKEQYEIATDVTTGFTIEEFIGYATLLQNNAPCEISDEMLNKVVGGIQAGYFENRDLYNEFNGSFTGKTPFEVRNEAKRKKEANKREDPIYL